MKGMTAADRFIGARILAMKGTAVADLDLDTDTLPWIIMGARIPRFQPKVSAF